MRQTSRFVAFAQCTFVPTSSDPVSIAHAFRRSHFRFVAHVSPPLTQLHHPQQQLFCRFRRPVLSYRRYRTYMPRKPTFCTFSFVFRPRTRFRNPFRQSESGHRFARSSFAPFLRIFVPVVLRLSHRPTYRHDSCHSPNHPKRHNRIPPEIAFRSFDPSTTSNNRFASSLSSFRYFATIAIRHRTPSYDRRPRRPQLSASSTTFAEPTSLSHFASNQPRLTLVRQSELRFGRQTPNFAPSTSETSSSSAFRRSPIAAQPVSFAITTSKTNSAVSIRKAFRRPPTYDPLTTTNPHVSVRDHRIHHSLRTLSSSET